MIISKFDLPYYCFNCIKFGKLILRKIIKIVATRCHIKIIAKKHQIRFRLGLRPIHCSGSLQRSSKLHIAGLRGPIPLRELRRTGEKGKGGKIREKTYFQGEGKVRGKRGRKGYRRCVVVSGVRQWTKLTHVGPGYNWDGCTISGCNQPTRSTQPCIPPGSLNRVPASAGVKAGMSPLRSFVQSKIFLNN